MHFVEMDPELIRKALEGYTNELAPEQKKLEAFYRQFHCQRCKSTSLRKEADVRHAFSDPDTLVPRSLLRCNLCSCLFDPFTGVQLERGNPAKIEPDIPIIDPTKK